MTNYRDNGFDFEFDIGSLFEYETPLRTSTVAKVEFVSLDRYVQGSSSIPAPLIPVLRRVAHLVVASFKLGMGIREVDLDGNVDTSGNDKSGQDLGKRRAEVVRDWLVKEMDAIASGTSAQVTFILSSGVTVPTQTSRHELNRRVVLRLPPTCQAFFAEYDLQSYPDPKIGFNSHPNVVDKQGRLNSVTFVTQELEARLAERAKQALLGKVMPAQPNKMSGADIGTIRKGVMDLSAMQLTLFSKYHAGVGGFSPDSMMSCFLKFANGELRSPHPYFDSGSNKGREQFGVGEPDSNHVFLFAEFAFLCLDWNITPATTLWARALPALVAPQEVFIHVYRKNPGPPPPPVTAALPALPANGKPIFDLTKYAAKHFKPINGSQTRGEGQSSAARLAELAGKYSKMMTVEQFRAAMSSNLLRAQMLT